MEQITEFRIGEVGSSKESEISESIIELGVDLTTDMTTEMNFTVFDPDFRMLRGNYFQVRRMMSYMGYNYEIAQVEMSHTAGAYDAVKVSARSAPIQKMRRETGAESWGSISPSMFAKQTADRHELKMFIQDSSEMVGITRQQGEDIEESTWDVLQRLAADLEYLVFESYGVLYFTSAEYLVERQPGITVDLFAGETDPWFPYSISLKQSDDDWKGSAFTLQVSKENGKRLRPGMTVSFANCGPFSDERKHLITSVTWSEGDPSPAAIQGRTLKETEDTVADTSVGVTSVGVTGTIQWGSRTLKEGMTGNDVVRLRDMLGLGTKDPDRRGEEPVAIFDAATKAAVMEWQRENKLGEKVETLISDVLPGDRHRFAGETTFTTYNVDGIIDDDDWLIIRGPVLTEKSNVSSKDADAPGTDSTAGALQIDSIDDADRKWYS